MLKSHSNIRNVPTVLHGIAGAGFFSAALALGYSDEARRGMLLSFCLAWLGNAFFVGTLHDEYIQSNEQRYMYTVI